MTLHHLKAADRIAAPWRNGGGVTREVMAHPPGADLSGFHWRVSIAEVASDGPFSVFEGVDRWMGVLTGVGIRLTIADASPIAATPEDGPIIFPGEVATRGDLIDGPISDVNLMVRRANARAVLRRIAIADRTDLDLAGPALLLWRDGDGLVRIGDAQAAPAPLDALYLDHAAPWRISTGSGATVWLVEFAET